MKNTKMRIILQRYIFFYSQSVLFAALRAKIQYVKNDGDFERETFYDFPSDEKE